MLTRHIKETLSRPHLDPVDESKVKNPPKLSAVEKLKLLKPIDFQNCDEIDHGDTDSLSDLNTPECFERVKIQVDRLEQAWQVMKSFSDDFKKALQEAKEEMKLENKLHYHDIDEATNSLEEELSSKDLSESQKNKLQEVLNKDFVCGEDLNIPDLDLIKKSEPQKKGTSNEFVTTPPNYYAEDEPYWMSKDAPDWQTMDASNAKCKKWLETHTPIVTERKKELKKKLKPVDKIKPKKKPFK